MHDGISGRHRHTRGHKRGLPSTHANEHTLTPMQYAFQTHPKGSTLTLVPNPLVQTYINHSDTHIHTEPNLHTRRIKLTYTQNETHIHTEPNSLTHRVQFSNPQNRTHSQRTKLIHTQNLSHTHTEPKQHFGRVVFQLSFRQFYHSLSIYSFGVVNLVISHKLSKHF